MNKTNESNETQNDALADLIELMEAKAEYCYENGICIEDAWM